MRRGWIGLLLVAISAAACAGSADAGGEAQAQPIVGMGTSPDPLEPLAADDLLALDGYAAPLATDDAGRPMLSARAVVYTPRWELWSDGAQKRRFIVLPEGSKIHAGAGGAFEFPEGARVFKEFYVDGHLLETRVIEKTAKGFHASTFLWSADGKTAARDTNGTTIGYGPTSHTVPAQADCANCHNDGKNVVLGLSNIQLAPDAADLAPLFDAPPTPFAWGSDVDTNTQATLGYLHANCGHCHREADDSAFFQLQTSDQNQPLASVKSYKAISELGGMMLYRISANEMPPLGVTRVDTRATTGDVADGIKKISGQY